MKNIDINQIKYLYYDEEKSSIEIAKIFDCSPATIRNWMKKHNLPRRPKKEAHKNQTGPPGIDIDLDELVRLYFEKQLPLAVIGAQKGTSGTTIRSKLLKAGYTLRSDRIRSSKFTDTDVSEMERLYLEEELALQMIAERFKCTAVTVGTQLKKRGIRLRNPKQAQVLRQKKEKAGVEESVKSAKVGKSDSVEKTPLPNSQTSELPNSQTFSKTYTPPKRFGKVFEPIPLIPPEEVTPERILQLRQEDDLTLDDIAAVCSLSTVDVYNILIENGSL
ncbi:helix-turn-helix domain-containing protein [Candidatus Poribacteria bacterium]|nr:helix-turn-helix domain-containing protein [Candidatus Poribacteria bacterium]MYC39534.1 helix-turn-helix domain-containing protein [Candidatus Dadabacteria bacterium]